MTRLERRRRRQWIAAWVILAVAVLSLVITLLCVKPLVEKEVERVAYDPPTEPISVIKMDIMMRTDYPKHYYRQDIPLDRYLQETLYNAAKEWNVPYELALAVCFRETNFRNLVTEIVSDDGTVRHYYGMMAVQLESAGYYMELCNVEYLNSEEDRLRVGCCILGEHIRNEGSIYNALCRYSNDYEGWYAESVLAYAGGLMG